MMKHKALVAQNSLLPMAQITSKLVEAEIVTKDQVKQALAIHKKTGRSVVSILEGMGLTIPPEVARQYKIQQLFELKVLYGVESVDLELDQIRFDDVAYLIQHMVPIEICRRNKVLPVKVIEPQTLQVAMVEPDNLDAQDDLNRVLRPQNFALQRVAITLEDFQQLYNTYRDQESADLLNNPSPKTVDVRGELEGLSYLQLIDLPNDDEMALDASDAHTAPVIALANKIMIKALQEGVSDIHLEPQEDTLRVRFRKDGVLHQAFEHFPQKLIPAMTARFKIMAALDIAERRQPQDGRIRRQFNGRKIDFRVSSLPGRYGEKIVLRILDNASTQLGLDKLVSDPHLLQTMQEMIRRPYGLILVTGPTGSGKTTTLYSALAERNEPGVNISTAEDPIEYSLPGIHQVQVLREKGMDFAAILRAFLRQDPDVILVGETRDQETAKTTIEAALTGHLVLTTLHTNDAAGAIARLAEMGIEPFTISGALIGVVAQRLVRRVCDGCKVAYTPTQEELDRFGIFVQQGEMITLYQAKTLTPAELVQARNRGTLCGNCGGAGYRGRCGVYEVMRINERLQHLITQRADTDTLKTAAVEEGMITLFAYSLNLVKHGHTTLAEVERVTLTDTGLEAERKAKQKSVLHCRSCRADLKPEWMECPYCLTPKFL